ncbi:hypothetical protein NAEGRDRAFT_79378 [Naegleria gruberi]|uniref:Uncharacterized protein n=1 Tax=Naegleria gruberi TaxID=5762 RepID=D2VBZ8_NAEGR|nr:uncharacterized protein NAEGRDRAFT_79378 [Naegleria gruberi]EFC45566.1 hypothetical protein NAEGRDRAFT_79378 [Naegleria gruberi]|eukprot:XP_002678310.1 hypothetical protein NAEGRDRAFT_79378 [Naegleria gruberi strain NEG-M]
MSADDTNNNNNLSHSLVENPEHINMQSNDMILDENIISDTNNNSSNNNNNSNNSNNNIITDNNDGQQVVEDNNVDDSLFIEESGNENQESELENIIMENEIINNIKYNNNPISEFNSNLMDNIKSIVDLFGNRPDSLITELNRFVQKFLQQNIEEIQFLKVKNHVLQELIIDLKSKAYEASSTQNHREETVILELSKMRREKSNNQISPPSPETNEYMQSSSAHTLLTGGASTNNPQRRTRRIRKKLNEPVHKVSSHDANESSDEDEDDHKMTDEHYRPNNDVYARLNSMRLSEIEYPSSDVNQPESDEDETENEFSTPEKPKKKKKKNTSDEDNDYIPNLKPQPRTNIISSHPQPPKTTTLVSPPSSSSIASSVSKPVNSSRSANIKPPIAITNPITIINNSGPPTQPTTNIPKRRGRPRRVRPEDTAANLQPSLSGPLGAVMTQPFQETIKNPLSTTAIQRTASTGTEDTTAPNSGPNTTTTTASSSNSGAFPSITPSDQKMNQSTNNNPAADSSQMPTTEMFSRIPPNMFESPASLQPTIQTTPSNGGESSSSNSFSANVYNQMMSQSLLAQQKKRGPKPGPRRGGSKAMFTIYDSNSFKLTYEKPGVTKITKASISNGPQTIFVDSDVSQYAELSNALGSIGGNVVSQFGNATDSQTRQITTNENVSSTSSNSKTTPITTTTTTTQPNNISNNNVASNSISTVVASSTDTGITSHNNSSSKASRRFTSHASNMINNNLNTGSPIIASNFTGGNNGGGILVMNPTSNNTAASHPFLVPSATNPKRNIEPNSSRDYFAQITTETKDGTQDNRLSVEMSSLAVVKHEEEERRNSIKTNNAQ